MQFWKTNKDSESSTGGCERAGNPRSQHADSVRASVTAMRREGASVCKKEYKNYLVSFAGFAPVDDPQLFVYVVVDVPDFPPGDQQAHSSFASNIFAKIMSEALPYLNVFPDGDLPEESQDPNGQTPSEGINTPASEDGANGENGETQPEETTKVYETDEYVDIDGGSGIPDAVPANADGTEESSAQVTFPNAGEATVPAQTDPKESASDESSEGAAAETESTENTQDQDPTQTQPPGV